MVPPPTEPLSPSNYKKHGYIKPFKLDPSSIKIKKSSNAGPMLACFLAELKKRGLTCKSTATQPKVIEKKIIALKKSDTVLKQCNLKAQNAAEIGINRQDLGFSVVAPAFAPKTIIPPMNDWPHHQGERPVYPSQVCPGPSGHFVNQQQIHLAHQQQIHLAHQQQLPQHMYHQQQQRNHSQQTLYTQQQFYNLQHQFLNHQPQQQFMIMNQQQQGRYQNANFQQHVNQQQGNVQNRLNFNNRNDVEDAINQLKLICEEQNILTKRLIQSVVDMHMNNWGRKESESLSAIPAEHSQATYEYSPVFYGPDGQNIMPSSYPINNNEIIDDKSVGLVDDDDEPEMDLEIQMQTLGKGTLYMDN